MADLDRMQLLQQEEGDIQNRIACLRRRLDINRKMQAELLDAVPLQPAVVQVTRPKAFVPPARPPPVQPKPEVPAKIKPEIITKAAIVTKSNRKRSSSRSPRSPGRRSHFLTLEAMLMVVRMYASATLPACHRPSRRLVSPE
jgi:hypothetical protein